MLPDLLIQLSKLYFRQLDISEEEKAGVVSGRERSDPALSYQCRSCMTIYDKKYGDPTAGIHPGTPFEKLPGDYLCPLCASEKELFIPVTEY